MDTHEACTPHPFGIRLVYADLLTERQKVVLRQVLERTEKKFQIGAGWLPLPLDAVSCGLSTAVTNRSLLQNDPLFSSEGLTLVPLDRLYTFKAALSSYSRTQSPLRLEDAVDELRRLVLSRKGAVITRAELAGWYEWLTFSEASITEVRGMYRRAYGGMAGAGGVEGVVVPTVEEGEGEADTDFESEEEEVVVPEEREMTPLARTVEVRFVPETTPPPKMAPVLLKLQTQFPAKAPARDTVMFGFTPIAGPRRDADEEEAMTARPGRESRQLWSPTTIAEVLHDQGLAVAGRSPIGPMTPNGYDDISPITRGEWGFLMVDGGVKQGMKTAAVVTF
ncbi:hypothetical protein F5X68DRAFT_239750 [Plectosphaerella plurivora]|uniref:DUF7582 domain-containing protein n=1 Tax=Plectosphaerella plurivora TaxID=936078 RepID=A0A9P8VD75_9PEZI|nr:hypothetical protein F5X68DRAFT_239750 [Plectosphaerella plurivora]